MLLLLTLHTTTYRFIKIFQFLFLAKYFLNPRVLVDLGTYIFSGLGGKNCELGWWGVGGAFFSTVGIFRGGQAGSIVFGKEGVRLDLP